jgi:Tol biopolymer transport system component
MHHDQSRAANNAIFYASLDGHENQMLIHSQNNAIYASGFLLFGRGDQLMAQPFDPSSGKLSGEAQTISSGVLNDVSTWHMTSSATDSGLLTFGNGNSGGIELVWVERGVPGGIAADGLQNLQYARLSPHGDRVAMTLDTGVNDIWSLDLARGVRTRLTFGPTGNTFPVWSPDEKWIAYSSVRVDNPGIYRRLSDGTGSEEMLVADPPGVYLAPNDWSHDGKTLFYSVNQYTGKDNGVWAIALDDRKPRQVTARGANSVLSPDGRWLAYNSDASGREEVYVEAFGGGQGKWQVSSNGGQTPHWSADGKQLFYFDMNQSILSVSVKEVGGALEFGPPQNEVNQWTVLTIPFFSVSPDSKRFLLERVSQRVNQPITLITNFPSTLKK